MDLDTKLVSFLEEENGPTTTTKALLITVTAPCHFCPRVAEDELPSTGMDQAEEATQTVPEDLTLEKAATDPEAQIEVTDDGVIEKEEETITTSMDNDDDGEDVHIVTLEEAAAVKIGDDAEAEIHVAELLRITFQTLLEEYHLLTNPTYISIEDKKVLAVPSGSDAASINGDPIPWIRVDVMVRPCALGVVLERLERIGVGTSVGSVSIYKSELCRTASPYLTLQSDMGDTESETDDETPAADASGLDPSKSISEKDEDDADKLKSQRLIDEAKQEWKNAATRLRIEQVREQIVEQAALSFDFISLLSIASILAGIGLITNNTVVIVASMLVSPIMGPCLGLTFGSRVQDWPLVRSSFVNESLSLCGCVIIGLIIGLCAGFTDLAADTWPTDEMRNRGEITGLVTGIAIAIPSGMGVCLSILGGKSTV